MYTEYMHEVCGRITVSWDERRHTLSRFFHETQRAIITNFDDEVEEAVDLVTGISEKYSAEGDAIDVEHLTPEMKEAILKYFADKYDAKYFVAKCVQPTVIGGLYLYLEDVQLLSAHRDSGLESLYVIDPRWVRSRIRNEAFDKLSKAEKRMCINTFRHASATERRKMNNIKDILEFAKDKTYLLRKRLNRGLPEVCKLKVEDIKWLSKHQPEAAARYRILEKFEILCKRYTEYLEYEYALERDVSDTYWRHNKQWYTEYLEMRKQGLEAHAEVVNRKIYDAYAHKQCAAATINGYTFMVTNDPEAWRKQARKLHQCIISCRYYMKQNSTICFCYKDGEPYATFEIRELRIIQSYRNEKGYDPDLMRVDEPCTQACLTYIQENNI